VISLSTRQGSLRKNITANPNTPSVLKLLSLGQQI
jgi:hypothetical protein